MATTCTLIAAVVLLTTASMPPDQAPGNSPDQTPGNSTTTGSLVDTANVCSLERLNQCTQVINKYGRTPSVIFPALPYLEVREICSLRKRVAYCLDKLLSKCDEFHRQYIRGVTESLDYICGENFIVYYYGSQCFRKQETLDVASECNRTYHDRTEILTTSTTYRGSADIRKQFCSTVRGFVSCLNVGIGKQCGKEAAHWQKEVFRLGLQPMLTALTQHDRVKCSLDGTDGGISRKALITGIMVCISILIAGAFVVCFLVVCRRNLKEIRRTRLENTPSAAL